MQDVLALLNDAFIIMEASEDVLLAQLPLPARGVSDIHSWISLQTGHALPSCV